MFQKKNLPKLMDGVPFFGNILQFMERPRDYFIDCYQHHGPLFRVGTPIGNVTIICGRLGKELLAEETQNGLTRKGLFRAFTTQVGVDVFEEADEKHEQTKSFLRLPYSRYITSQFIPEIQLNTEKKMSHFYEGESFELFHFCTELALTSVMKTVTPIGLEDLLEDFYPYADRVMDVITQRLPHFTTLFPVYRNRRNRVWDRIDEVIERHLSGEFKNEQKVYVIDAILNNVGENPDQKTKELIRGVLIYLLAGSVGYTSRLLFFFLYEVFKNKHLHGKIMDELWSAFGNGPIDSRVFRRMPYFRGAYLETLRLYPMLPGLPFKAEKEVQLQGKRIPKGSKIIFVPQTEHFDEKNYQDAYHFRPERFLPSHKSRFKKDSLFPFGLSKRSCSAQGSQEILAMTVVASFLRSHQTELLYPGEEFLIKMNPLIGPDRPVKVIFKRKIKDYEFRPESIQISEAFDFESPFEHEKSKVDLPDVETESFKENERIINQGDAPDGFYILTDGFVEVIKDGVKVAELGPGDSFGETGLIKKIPRNATIKTKTPVHVVKFSKEEFLQIVMDLDLEGKELAIKFQRFFLSQNIKKSIPHIGKENLEEILSDFKFKHFSPDEIIIKQGDAAHTFYIVISGSAEVYSEVEEEKTHLAFLEQGDIFGELGIVNKTQRTATVVARENLTAIEIPRDYLLKLLKESKSVEEDLYSLVFSRIKSNIEKGEQ
jgi:CRP-like cAMP-binding protein/cytochrome P450